MPETDPSAERVFRALARVFGSGTTVLGTTLRADTAISPKSCPRTPLNNAPPDNVLRALPQPKSRPKNRCGEPDRNHPYTGYRELPDALLRQSASSHDRSSKNTRDIRWWHDHKTNIVRTP